MSTSGEGCPLCDGLGLIDDPLRPKRLKKCPECDTPPSPYFLPLSVWLDHPDAEDLAGFEREVADHLAKRRAEDAAVAAHARTASPDCSCEWCTVRT